MEIPKSRIFGGLAVSRQLFRLSARFVIASPILSNIYLHELDKFVMKLAENFDRLRTQKYTDEYGKISNKLEHIRRKLKIAEGDERTTLIERKKTLHKELLKTPSKSQTDKRIKYIRYADDFIIGVNGSKEDCQRIKKQLSEFIAENGVYPNK